MSIYLERLWTKMYDSGVPASLEPYPAESLQQQLDKTAEGYPGKDACITSAEIPVIGRVGSAVTWKEINDSASYMAACLADMGLHKGDVVAIIMPNCTQFLIAFYGVLKAGGIVSAANPTYPAEKLVAQIADSNAKIVIALTMFYGTFKSVQKQTKVESVIVTNIKEYLPRIARWLFSLTNEKRAGHHLKELAVEDIWFQDVLKKYSGCKQPDLEIDPAEDIAIFQYTGGTTGVPKGAMSTHRALVSNTHTMQRWLGGDDVSKDLLLGAIPFFHVYGLVTLVAYAASSGATIISVPNARDIDDVVGNICKWKPTMFMGVPALFNAINNHQQVIEGSADISSLRVCFSGSASLAPGTKRRFEKLASATIVEGFGMSETPTATHCNPLGRPCKEQSIGVPFPDVDCRIVNLVDGVTDMPIGDEGELIIRGPNTMIGYLNMRNETAKALRDLRDGGAPWLYTGDVAYMDSEGYFFVVDRMKDMAVIGGFNVYPTVVENALAEHKAVLEVGVTSIPHPEKTGEEALLACVVLNPGELVTGKELIEFQARKLAPHEIARRIAFLPELPKTTVGKPLRRDLARAAG